MNSKLSQNLSRISFTLLLIVTIFGTSIPFRERLESVEDVGSSNIVNQVVYGSLLILSVMLLFKRKKDLAIFIVKEKFLSMLIFWCILSMVWSPDPFVTFKRIFQLVTIVLVSISFLFYSKDESYILNHFKYVIFTYLVLSIIAVLIVPQAKDPQFGTWRGFTPHKNNLGGIGVVMSVLCYMIFTSSKNNYGKVVSAFMLFLAAVLVVGSFSSTAIIALTLLFSAWLIFSADKIFKPIGISRLVSTSAMIFILLAVAGIFIAIPDATTFLPKMFGKDTSYSGRTDLWEYLWNEIMRHPIHGIGYQGYWNVNRLKYSDIYEVFLWIPQQAHNGYLDVLNEIGVVGILLLLLMIFNYFINFTNVFKPYLWIFLFIIPMLTNLSESSYLRPGKEMNFVFLFSYIHLFYSVLFRKQKAEDIKTNIRRYR